MEAWAAAHPIPAGAVILGLFWLLVKVLSLAWPLIWKQASNEGLVTKEEMEKRIRQVQEEEGRCQQHIAQELAIIKKAMLDGDGWFIGLREANSDLALTVRDLCMAFKEVFEGNIDCERLRRWITSQQQQERIK